MIIIDPTNPTTNPTTWSFRKEVAEDLGRQLMSRGDEVAMSALDKLEVAVVSFAIAHLEAFVRSDARRGDLNEQVLADIARVAGPSPPFEVAERRVVNDSLELLYRERIRIQEIDRPAALAMRTLEKSLFNQVIDVVEKKTFRAVILGPKQSQIHFEISTR